MKLLFKSALTVAALFAVTNQFSKVSAMPLPQPLDDYDLDLTVSGTATETYNSNVLSAPGGTNKFDDFVTTFAPGLELEWGKNSITDVTFNYTETFNRYARRPSLNDELSSVGLNAVRKQGPFTLTGTFGFTQNATNSPSAIGGTSSPGGLIRSDVLSVGSTVHYDLSEKFNMNAGLSWARTSYLYSIGEAYQNSDSYTLPISAYYVYTPELSFGLGYTYNQTDQKNSFNPYTVGRERDSHTFSFDTQLTKWQKLTGSASVGVTINSIQGVNAPVSQVSPSLTTTTGSYSLGLQYDYSDKLAFTLNGTRNFTVGVSGQNVENTGAGLGLIYNYSSQISVQATLINFNYSQYLQSTPSRDDQAKTTGISVTWQPLDYLSLTAAYTYFMNSSTAPNATYNINTISISGSIHY